MRCVGREEERVGLLLFDEPSASLDPIAEHGKRDPSEPSPCGCVDVVVYTDLFDRLRQLRGSKTMVFSSHRFGKLTRHADLILCVACVFSPLCAALADVLLAIWTTQGSLSQARITSCCSGKASMRVSGTYKPRRSSKTIGAVYESF